MKDFLYALSAITGIILAVLFGNVPGLIMRGLFLKEAAEYWEDFVWDCAEDFFLH